MDVLTGNTTNHFICDSPVWDNQLFWLSSRPQLSRCFRQTILTAFPPIVLLLLTPFDFRYFLFKQRPIQTPIQWQLKNISSAVLNLILIAISFSHLVRIVCQQVFIWSTVYEPSVDLTGFVMSFILLIIFKQNGRRISISLQMYWFWTTIVSIIRLYFESNSDKSLHIFYQMVYCFYILLSIVLFALSSICDNTSNRIRLISEELRQQFDIRDDNYCALENNTAFSRLTLFWLFPFLWKGLRQSIETKDLNELCFSLKAEYNSKQFNKFDKKYNSKAIQRVSRLDRKHNKRLFPLLWCLTYKSVLISVLLISFQIPTLYAQPLILNKILDFLNDWSEEQWHGLVYALAYCLTGVLATYALQYSEIVMQNTAIRVKSALVSAVYKKIFRMSAGARKQYTSGEIVNIMAIDCQEMFNFFCFCIYIFYVPISLVIGFYLLWQYLGIASIGCILVMAFISPINALIGRKFDKLQKIQMSFKDKRMSKISEILNSIKIIKLNAWELPFIEMVTKLRHSEQTALKKMAILMTFVDVVWVIAPMLLAAVSFTIYVFIDYSKFNGTTIFVSLAILNVLRTPMAIIPGVFYSVIRAIVSHNRLAKFLNAEELEEYRSVGHKLENNNNYSLRIESASFCYGLEEEPVLKDISIDVTKGALIAVIGEVGAGKSSLLTAIIGDLYKTKGRIEVNGSVAYVPQTAWIQNKTLKDNILFISDEDEDRYKEVLSACALLPDLIVLPAGDQTEIGEKGINLSGGQKQRVSLGRAVYQDSELYLLDDPLSAVDAHVGKQLFDEVIGPKGLLRSKTRILCTHNLSFLQNCDQIYVLRDGQVVGFGDYNELSTLGLLSQIEVSHQLKTFDNLSENEDILSLNKSEISEDIHQKRSTSESLNANIIEEEFMETGSVRWKDYGRYVISAGIIGFVGFVLLRIAFNLSEVSANYWLSVWTNRNSSQSQIIGRKEGLVIYGSLIAIETILILIGDILIFFLGIKAAKTIHLNAFNGVMHSPLSFFDKTPTGRVLNRFSKDISDLDEQIPSEFACIFEKIMWFPILYVLIAVTFAYLSLALLAIILFFYAIYKFYLMTCRQFRRLESVSNSPVQSFFCECIAGAQSIRAFDVLPQFIVEFNKKLDLSLNCFYHSISLNFWLRLWANTTASLITLMIALYIVYNRHNITVGLAGLLLTYAVEAVNWIVFLIRNMAALETHMISVERLREFSELSAESDWNSTKGSKPSDDWPEKGCIEYQNYSMTYRTGLKPVLKNVNFVVKSGEKVGVCGRTGAGKSSLALSLFRIIEALDGRILIDGLDIKTIGLHDLRRRLTIIPQDPILFADTLRMNLDPLGDYTDAQLWTALSDSNLSEFVRQLPEELDYTLTEGGDNLSAGQRQLVCLARALLRGSRILVLDEAMSACDIETDRIIQNTIRHKFNECTLLTIAHRLNTIIDYDRILVLEFGQIVENDSPKNLLSNENSIFYSLAKEAKII